MKHNRGKGIGWAILGIWDIKNIALGYIMEGYGTCNKGGRVINSQKRRKFE